MMFYVSGGRGRAATPYDNAGNMSDQCSGHWFPGAPWMVCEGTGKICPAHAPRIPAWAAGPLIAIFREARERCQENCDGPEVAAASHFLYRYWDAAGKPDAGPKGV
jgi:hypothetical protein